MKLTLNLARRPFVNDRPLVIATIAVVVLGALASFGNVYLLLGALSESRLLSARLVAERTETEEAKREAKALEAKLSDKEKRRVRLVATSTAAIIQKRALSWSRLFDEIELILPRDVRILTILPEPQGKRRMSLIMECMARTNEAKLKYYAKLHEPPFSDAYIIGESYEDGKTRFQVRCRYDPEGSGAEPLWEPMPWQPKEDPRKAVSSAAALVAAPAPAPSAGPSGPVDARVLAPGGAGPSAAPGAGAPPNQGVVAGTAPGTSLGAPAIRGVAPSPGAEPGGVSGVAGRSPVVAAPTPAAVNPLPGFPGRLAVSGSATPAPGGGLPVVLPPGMASSAVAPAAPARAEPGGGTGGPPPAGLGAPPVTSSPSDRELRHRP